MSDDNKPTQEETVACQVCMKEVPISEAKNEEATDYVMHFCGLECYDKWKKEEQEKK